MLWSRKQLESSGRCQEAGSLGHTELMVWGSRLRTESVALPLSRMSRGKTVLGIFCKGDFDMGDDDTVSTEN